MCRKEGRCTAQLKPLPCTLLILLTTSPMGVSFPVGKIGMGNVSPLLLMAIRFILAGLLTAKKWPQVAVAGLFQPAGVMGFSYYSVHWITSGEAAILTFANPLLVHVFGTLLFGARYRPVQWAGVVAGMLGELRRRPADRRGLLLP